MAIKPWSRRTVRSETSALAAIDLLLSMMAEQLKDVASDVDTSVTGVCSGFQGMATTARDALNSASAALESSSEGGGLQAFAHRVKICVDALLHRLIDSEQCSTQLVSELKLIRSGMDMLVKLGENGKKLSEETTSIAQRIRELGRRPDRSKCDEIANDLLGTSDQIRDSAQTLVLLNTGLRSALKNAEGRAAAKAGEESQAIASSSQTVQNALEQLTDSYKTITDSLSGSALASRQLNLDISQAVVAMQFQDRVNQRIDHLVEAISELQEDMHPFLSDTDELEVQSLTEFLMNRVSEKSTMESERRLSTPVMHSSSESDSSDDDSFELF